MQYGASILKIPQTIAIAIEVINNVYGTGEERKKALESSGYNYDEIQSCVNELFPIFQKYEE